MIWCRHWLPISYLNRYPSGSSPSSIAKTYLYNIDLLKPHFYIVKLWFTGYTLFFLFLLKSIDCGYSLETPHRGGSNKYPQSMFWTEIWNKYQNFYLKTFSFGGENFNIFERACFRNVISQRAVFPISYNKPQRKWNMFSPHRSRTIQHGRIWKLRHWVIILPT